MRTHLPASGALRGDRDAGVGKLHKMAESTADVLGLDWSTDMAEARAALGPDRVLQGNVDPAVLFASEVSHAPVPSSCPLMLHLLAFLKGSTFVHRRGLQTGKCLPATSVAKSRPVLWEGQWPSQEQFSPSRAELT